jgi:Heterokaryon incompatibility protein (HET)
MRSWWDKIRSKSVVNSSIPTQQYNCKHSARQECVYCQHIKSFILVDRHEPHGRLLEHCRGCEKLTLKLGSSTVLKKYKDRRSTDSAFRHRVVSSSQFSSIGYLLKEPIEDISCPKCGDTLHCPSCIRMVELFQSSGESDQQSFRGLVRVEFQHPSWSGLAFVTCTWDHLRDRELVLSRENIRLLNTSCTDIQLLKAFVEDCKTCSEAWEPTALDEQKWPQNLKIILMDLKDRKLVWGEASTIPEQPYVALSYVWGIQQDLGDFECSKSRLDRLFEKGSLDDAELFYAPRTVRDAMSVLEKMDQRFLWIDRYCIVQDDQIHKHTQLMSMGLIYAKAQFCLVSADGDAYSGLSGWKTESHSNTGQNRLNNCFYEQDGRSILAGLEFSNMDYRSIWATRGWTFQEEIFSQRRLIFHQGHIFWICRHGFFKEDFIGSCLSESRSHDNDYFRSRFHLRPQHWPDLRYFQNLLEKFNLRDLTYPCDTLSAISGIIGILRDDFAAGFHFGMPEIYFDIALLWRAEGNLQDRKDLSKQAGLPTQALPSWSWARWQGSISYRPWDMFRECLYGRTVSPVYQVSPLVDWVKISSDGSRDMSIANGYSTYRHMQGDENASLPPGWRSRVSSTGEVSFLFFDLPGYYIFRYPIPIAASNAADRLDKVSWLPQIRASVMTTSLDIVLDHRQQVMGQKQPWNMLWSSRLHEQVGVLSLDRCLSEDNSFSPETPIDRPAGVKRWRDIKVIAISKGARSSLQSSSDGYNVEPLQIWEVNAVESVGIYEFYNVLFIMTKEDGLSERCGVGRIKAELWNKDKHWTEDIVLG